MTRVPFVPWSPRIALCVLAITTFDLSKSSGRLVCLFALFPLLIPFSSTFRCDDDTHYTITIFTIFSG